MVPISKSLSVEVMRLVCQLDRSSSVQRGYDKPSNHADYQAYEIRNMTFKICEPVLDNESPSFRHSGFV